MRIAIVAAVALSLTLAVAPSVQAITFEFASGNRAGEATFTKVGSNLVVQLTNTSTYDVTKPTDVLTGVFFDLQGNVKLSALSAVLAPGSSVLFDSAPVGGVVGGEWAYNKWASNVAPGTAHQGISSSGLGLFGSGDRFPGSDLDSPASPDGLNYGLTSAGDNPLTGNKPVTGKEPLILNSVIFTLGGLAPDFDPTTDIFNVWFQYGTDLCEPHFSGTSQPPPPSAGAPVPEPITLTGLTLGVAGIARYLRRRNK